MRFYVVRLMSEGRRFSKIKDECKVFDWATDETLDIDQTVDKLNELDDFGTDVHYALCLLRRVTDELIYFTEEFDDEVDITVTNVIRDVNLFLGDREDNFTGYIDYIIDSKEDLEKENKKLKERLENCTKRAKEEIRKQEEENAIRWANIGR